MGNPPPRAMPNPPESPLSVDSDSAISDDTAVKMEHSSLEAWWRGGSQPPGGATRLSTVQESASGSRGETADSRPEENPVSSEAPQSAERRAESVGAPASSPHGETDQHQESTSVAPGDAADSRPEANPAVADVPQEVVSSTAQPRGSQLNPESHLRSEIGSYATESKETEENRGAVAGKGEIAFPGTHGIGFTHLPLLQVRESPFGGEMVPNLPREDLLIGQIDPARLISSTEVPENFSTVGLVLGEPTAQAGPTDSKDSRPR